MSRRHQSLLLGLTVFLISAFLIAGRWFHQKSEAKDPNDPRGGVSPAGGDNRLSAEEREWNEKSAAAHKAFEAAADEQLRKALAAPVIQPLIPLDVEGNPRKEAMQKLGLSETEVAALQKVVAETKAAGAKDFIRRARLISTKAAGGETSYDYYARAIPDRGEAARNLLAQQVEGAIGAEKAKRFMGEMGPQALYGGLGRYDVHLVYTRDRSGQVSVRNEYIGPVSGEIGVFGGGPLDDINYRQWNLIELPK